MSNYWEDRERDHIRRQMQNDASITRRLKSKQQEAMREIETQIFAYYSRYASREGITPTEAMKIVSKLDIEEYKAKAKRYVRERNFTTRANHEMRLYNLTMQINSLELLKENIRLELIANTSDVERFIQEELTTAVRAEYERQSSILGGAVKTNEKNVKRIVNASFLTANWSDRIWFYQTALRNELDTLLSNAINQGLNPRVIAQRLRDNYDTTTYNAERLMRTELARVQGDVFKDSMEQGEFSQYVYVAEPDACPVCSSLDGEVFNISQMQIGVNMYPMHPNCRCSTAAYVDRDAWDAELRARGL